MCQKGSPVMDLAKRDLASQANPLLVLLHDANESRTPAAEHQPTRGRHVFGGGDAHP
jgi:hypothetical protein